MCSAAGPTREEDGVLPVAVVVVLLAHELELVQDVQLLPGGQLLVAHHAREAVEVKDFALGPAHQVAGQDPLRAAVTLGAEPPVGKHTTVVAAVWKFHSVKGTRGSKQKQSKVDRIRRVLN